MTEFGCFLYPENLAHSQNLTTKVQPEIGPYPGEVTTEHNIVLAEASIGNVNHLRKPANSPYSGIYIDTDELPGCEVAFGSINYLRITQKKEHQETPLVGLDDKIDYLRLGNVKFIVELLTTPGQEQSQPSDIDEKILFATSTAFL